MYDLTGRRPFTILFIKNLSVSVHLGITKEERRQSQPVYFNIQIRLPTPPPGCLTDQITDTICYATLCEKVKNYCEGSDAKLEFNLIEKLAWDVHTRIQECLPPGSQVSTSVTKTKLPPIDYCENAQFCIQDWEHP